MSAFQTLVVLLRHGESEANVFVHEAGKMSHNSEEMTKKIASAGSDPRLSEKGIAQANVTADNLRERLLYVDETSNVSFFASPMQRAKQTAMPIANTLPHKKIVFDNNMIEYDGTTYEEAVEFVHKVVRFYFMLQRKARLACEDQTFVLIGHSLFFSLLLHVATVNQRDFDEAKLCQMVTELCVQRNFINVLFHLPNCSISSMQINEKGQWKILGVGKTDHLPYIIKTGHHSLF